MVVGLFHEEIVELHQSNLKTFQLSAQELYGGARLIIARTTSNQYTINCERRNRWRAFSSSSSVLRSLCRDKSRESPRQTTIPSRTTVTACFPRIFLRASFHLAFFTSKIERNFSLSFSAENFLPRSTFVGRVPRLRLTLLVDTRGCHIVGLFFFNTKTQIKQFSCFSFCFFLHSTPIRASRSETC